MHFDSNEHVAGQPGLYGGSSVSLDLWVWNDQPATVGKGKQRAVDDEQDDWVLLLKYHVHLDHLVPLGASVSPSVSHFPDMTTDDVGDAAIDLSMLPTRLPCPPIQRPQRLLARTFSTATATVWHTTASSRREVPPCERCDP